MFCIFDEDLIIQAQEDSKHAYEVLFRGLHVFWIAIVNKQSDIVWVVAITIWEKKGGLGLRKP
jgi:hypothetical protein